MPVIVNDRVFTQVRCLRYISSAVYVDIPVVQHRRQVQFLDTVETLVVFNDKVADVPGVRGAWSLVQKTADSPKLQFIDKVWTSLRLCSDVSRSGRCHRFSSSPDTVDIPVCTETGCSWVRGCDA